MSSYIKQPTVERLSTLIQQLHSGEIQIARFQRPYVWTDEQRVNLLDSIMRGMPIGSITVWRTAQHRGLKIMDSLDGLKLPAPAKQQPYSQYILDGLQRMTTLYGALAGALYDAGDLEDLDEERPPLYIDLAATIETFEESRFVVARGATTAEGRREYEAKNPTMMPASVLLKNARLARFTAKLLDRDDGELLSNRAENIADIFRDYNIPIIPLALEDLEHVTLAFTRINNAGTPMSQLHMLNALTFLEADRQQPPLMERVETFREESMTPQGWGELGDSAILQILRYLLGRGLYDDDVEALGEALRQRPELLDEAFALIQRTIDAFASIHITSAGVLPYSIQFVLTAAALHANDLTELDELRRERLWHWTILTGLSGYFSGITSTRLRSAQKHLLEILAVDHLDPVDGPLLTPRDFPYEATPHNRFDWRAARSRAFALRLAWARREDGYLQALAKHGRNIIRRRYMIPNKIETVGNIYLAPLGPNGALIPTKAQKIPTHEFHWPGVVFDKLEEHTKEYAEAEQEYISNTVYFAS